MENIFDAILFAVLIAAGGLGLSSWLMLFGIDKSQPAEVKQRSVFEYGFFGLAGIIIMFLMWYAIS
ncbi:hypothetical protein [Idiomarina sp. HP20-50]|uniref:hypothetical protein n=1 Tax=Idiomarina sp. HP20-50 TaxID=3070813 RepID=UPI00294B335A|nr:hypothetical protein [Idiomarina sp. HP20-50]MDV6315479.1 hypothetical protein [Idiomarina sp. HP20-50]